MSNSSESALDSIAAALFQASPGNGVHAGTALFEEIIEGLSFFITRQREPATEVLRFPPVMSRQQLEKSGYLRSFPHLLGCVSCLNLGESEMAALVEGRRSDGDWTAKLSSTELVLTPAACYPVYPLVGARGAVSAEGLRFDVSSYCFRREATHEIDRLQAFRMREFVCVGTASQASDFRDRWISRAEVLAEGLGLGGRIAPASDPFFGRLGRLAATMQVEQSLKFELLIPVDSEEQPTACMSFNYHRDHFGCIWALQTEQGETAHTACVAFGLDRLALALFAKYGIDLHRWPAAVRGILSV